MKFQSEQKIAAAAALAGGKVVGNFFGKQIVVKEKNGNPLDLQTSADLTSEKKIIQTIRNRFPNHTIIGEESGTLKKQSPYSWLIDPLDGTTNFTLTLPCLAVSVALAYQNKIVAAAGYLPITNDLYTAYHKRGASHNGQSIAGS